MRKIFSTLLLCLLTAQVYYCQVKPQCDTIPGNSENSGTRRILTETGSGLLYGSLGCLGGGLLGVAIAGKSNEAMREFDKVLLGGTCGMVLGSEIGIYLISKNYNEKVSFWEMAGVGVASGLGAALLTGTVTDNGWHIFLAGGFTPMLSSIVYSNLVYPTNGTKVVVLPQVSRVRNSNSYGLSLSVSL